MKDKNYLASHFSPNKDITQLSRFYVIHFNPILCYLPLFLGLYKVLVLKVAWACKVAHDLNLAVIVKINERA
jgi:hypothetical protein